MYKLCKVHTFDADGLKSIIDTINHENGIIRFIEHEQYAMYIIYEVSG